MLTAAYVALLFGRIVTADSEPAAGLRVVVEWSRSAARTLAPDTLDVDRYGRFATPAPESVDDSVVVSIVAAPDSRYYPTRIIVSRSRLVEELRVVVIPREWTIRRGRFAGSTVRIFPSDALRRTPDLGSFGRVTNRHVVGWDAASFPLRVVLRHDMAPNISARDSIAFWEAAHEVEESIGLTLFQPTSDTTGDNRVFPIDVRLDPGISPSGLTFVSWDRTGRLFEGSVRFRTSREIEHPSVVAHELLHALGFGHTTAWPSAMQARGPGLPGITAEDAAFAQLLMRLHDLQDDPLLVGGLLETAATVLPIPR